MEGKSFLVGTALAGIAVWAFFSFSNTHDAEQELRSLEHSRDVAEFKRDFAKAFDGKDNTELVERARRANTKLDAAENRASAVIATEREKRDNVEASLERSMSKDGVDLKAIEAKVNQAKN